ncbi:valine--tRNA ligase [Candidatus Saccharibacteria bacterium]|nr:valine--tRNA ligase [Candidatus Saccharibacteria bacterium]
MKFAKSYEPGDKEPEIYAAWEAASVFQPKVPQYPVNDASLRGADSEKDLDQSKYYGIVMPPPNANGNLHIGHGLTVALEDSLVRYYRLRGRSTWYIPGADHAGFETWVVYEKSLEKVGKSRFEYSRDELYAQVWDFVEEQRGNMELQLRALGASCAWNDLTFTLDENVVARVYKTFEKMWNDGMIYRGEKLVNYCPKHRTAFADIEVEHKDEKGTLWEIAYPGDDFELIVSTTRPETLFGDVAVAVNPEDERYKNLVGQHVRLPLTKREIPVIADEHADMEYGTGVVKITPAHDYDDFEVGERHDLPRIQVIGEDGTMLDTAGVDYAGLTTEDCRKKALKDLKEQGLLRGEKKIEHAVAHCYKCGTVIEPMLKEQWFIDVEKLAELAIERLENHEIKFFPANKKKVLINYLRGLKDWNISRQIPWGIAIPMFRKANEDATDSPDWIFDTRTNLTEIEVGGVKYVRDEDTFDTWFSSAHWPMICTDWVEDVPNPYYPLNVMETGADILFAWVARMIMIGVYVTGEVPFREVYLHGLVLDEHGQKMSKSKGNVINPMDLVTKYGSDAFRLGILRGRSAGMNQAFSENSVVSGRNLCNKLWNVARLIEDIVEENENFDTYTTLNTGEDWICREIDQCREKVELDMMNYRFAEAVETLYSTIWDKYADWFLESQKIYRNSPLLKKTLEMILIMLHPFAPFVTEAIWQNLSWTEDMIITQKWPAKLEYDPMTASEFERIIDIVSEVRATSQVIEGGKRWKLLYGDDSLVAENTDLIKKLTGVPAVESCEGQPRGLRLATMNSEIYLDVPEKVVTKYRTTLEEKILEVGRELDALNARMMNPAYVDKAPIHLVKQTQDGIKEKQALIERLKRELEVI